jgi:ADP-ribose pyrophosphatase YjhB (NUDIX family)
MAKLKKVEKGWLTDADYDLIYSNAPRICVDLVVKSSAGVVLTLRTIEPYKNSWHLPGGRVRFKESITQAIDRIALGELNIKVRVIKMLGFMEFLREKQNNSPRHTVSIVFLVAPEMQTFASCWQSSKIANFKQIPTRVHNIHARFLLDNKLLKKAKAVEVEN